MKKSRRILLVSAGTLVALVLLTAVLVPPLAKWYLHRNGKELVGRTVRMDKLRFNLFTGNLRIDGFRMLEADDSTVFAAFDRLETGVKLRALLARRIVVRRLALTHPDIALYQHGSRFNFDDLIARFASSDTGPEARSADAEDSDSAWELALHDISIAGGHLYYKDTALDAVWEFNNLGLSIPGVYFAGPGTEVGLLLQFAGGGELETALNYDMEHADFDLQLRLRNLSLDGLLPYLRQTTRAGGLSGLLSTDLRLKGNTEHLSDLTASGRAELYAFRLCDAESEPVLRVDTLHIELSHGDFRESQMAFDRIFVSGLAARYIVRHDGSNNLTDLLAPPAGALPDEDASRHGYDPATSDSMETTETSHSESGTGENAASPSARPLRLRIADLEVRDGSLSVSDRSLIVPFDYRISDIRLQCRDFDPDHRNSLQVDARMQRTGSAHIRWQGMLRHPDDHNILVRMSNIDLRDFSPYCEQFTAYPLMEGNLTFRSQNIITNRHLSGTNHLDMYGCTVEKKRKDHTPEYRIPLKLGLYVLTDKKGHVKIDLPVKGHLDAPEFSYRKIVMKALGNVLLKVVTAPFSFLSGNGDNLTHIDLEPLAWDFSSEQYARLDRIAGLLKEKPELNVVFTQRINRRQAIVSLAEIDLKTDYYRRQSDTLQPIGLIEFEKIQAMTFRSEAIHAFADSLLTTRGIDPSRMPIKEKAVTLYADKAAGQLRQLMLMRDKALREYMTVTHGIPEGALRIDTLCEEERNGYTGKNRYTLAVEMDGELYDMGIDTQAGSQTEQETIPAARSAPEAATRVDADKRSATPHAVSAEKSGSSTTVAADDPLAENPSTAASGPLESHKRTPHTAI